jgi:hypothetical protein
MQTKFTSGPWHREAMGGSSTVLCPIKPGRNDTRIPSYGYRDEEHCVAYPFLDEKGDVARRDFVCFSHEDAHLIAAAPDLLEALKALVRVADQVGWDANLATMDPQIEDARAAIRKATGE